jgi:hypothetical protein
MPVDIFFLNVGQGDCTLIRFTDDSGKITGAVLLDCGTIKPISRDWNVDGGAKCKPQVVQRLTEVVRTQLGAYNTLDYVILSHPDEDHHSVLPAVLRNLTGVKVGRIWYGGDYGDYKAPVQELLDRHARSHPGDVDAVRRVEHLAIAERVELDATETPTGPQVYLVEAQEFDSATGLVKLPLPPESLIAKRKKGDLDRWARDQLKDEARVSAKEMTEKIRQKIAGMSAKTRKEIEDAAVLRCARAGRNGPTPTASSFLSSAPRTSAGRGTRCGSWRMPSSGTRTSSSRGCPAAPTTSGSGVPARRSG